MDNSSNFTPIDSLGLLAGFGIKPQPKQAEQGPPMPTPAQRDTASAAELARIGNEKEPGRYELVPESDAIKWQDEWRGKEASSGFMGDAKRLVQIGTNSTILGLREAVRMIPKAGPAIVDGIDSIDRWMTGKDSETILKDNVALHEARLTPAMQEARKKEFVTEKKNDDGTVSYSMGPAWSDPRSYIAGAVESVPGTAVSMLPGGVLARGAYLRSMAAGVGEKAAAAAAARTALIAGGITEGIVAGGQTAHEIRGQIAALPEDVLSQSHAYQDLIKGGKTATEARAALANDSAVKGFLLAGVATGMFGGRGDQALARIVAEGVHGGLGKRILSGAGRGAISEGLLEELPQSIGEKVAENYVMRDADSRRSLTEGVANAAVSGAIAGGIMGAGFGGAGGAASRRAEDGAAPIQIDTPAQASPIAEPPKGPLARAVEYGVAQEAARAPIAPPVQSGLPSAGESVAIMMEGGESFTAKIEGYKDGEALVSDPVSGEILQVPISAIGSLTPEQFAQQSANDAEAARSAPEQPLPVETRTELPPARETIAATVMPSTIPTAGQRTIVDTGVDGRFGAAVQGYVSDPATGKEDALVRRDDGTEAQVPIETLRSSSLTPAQAKKQDAAKSPPVQRDRPAGGKVRSFANRFVELPDDLHARLYDYGRLRQEQMRMPGGSRLLVDQSNIGEQGGLAKELGLRNQELNQIADDYRYRVEHAARAASSDLPVKMHKVNEKLLERKRGESARAEEKAAQTSGASTVPPPADMKSATDEMAHEAATSPQNDMPQPTEAQKEAGNYKKGHVTLGGLDIAVENPVGSMRSGTDKGGKAWSVKMQSHYGYIKGTVGKDKDHIDVFIKPGTETLDDKASVFIVDQVGSDGARDFDEHKVMIGFGTPYDARQAYLANYSKGWKGIGQLSETTMKDFKTWLATGDTAKPYAQMRAADIRENRPNAATSDDKSVLTQAKPDPVKWFGARDRAQAYMDKKKFGATHEIIEAGRNRFEVRPKAQVPSPQAGMPDNEGETKGTIVQAASEGAREEKQAFNVKLASGEILTLEAAGYGDARNLAVAIMDERGIEGGIESILRARDDRGGKITDSIKTLSQPSNTVVAGKKSNWFEIGTNGDGNRVFEDERGVRSFVRDGIRTTEPVRLAPNAEGGTDVSINKDDRSPSFLISDERERQEPEAKPTRVIEKASGPRVAEKVDALFANNTLFTADKVEAARARLREKMNRLNAGIDPEVLLDGMVIAGAYIESGVRSFADYTKRMTDDLGNNIKPYLLSFWEGARNFPGLDTAGMTSVEESKTLHEADLKRSEPASGAEPGPDVNVEEKTPRGGAEVRDDTKPDAGRAAQGDAGQSPQSPPRDDSGQNAGIVSGSSRGAGDGLAGRGEGSTRGSRENPVEPTLRGDAPGAASEAEYGDQDARGNRPSRGDSGDRDADSKRQAAGEDQQPDIRADQSDESERSGAAGSRSSAGAAGRDPVRSAVGINHRIAPGDLKREGSWKVTAERNVSIVELVNQIERDGRRPTAGESALLTRFTGWGASEIANGVFPDRAGNFKPGWESIGARLRAALTDEEYAQAKRTTQYAHYTGEDVIRPIYSALERMGFAGGRVLEPGMGIGLFNGLMPSGIASNSRYTGIEYDTITGRIAKQLYPQSDVIIGDYAATPLPKDFFDLAIGNPPFSSTVVSNDPEYKKFGFMLHDYFFAKTIDRVKPGGFLIFVTSKGTMDKANDRARRYLAARADLVGAVRLPQTAFKENAGTDVVTDILFLQKRAPGAEGNGVAWKGTAEVSTPQGLAQINEYFAEHPEMVLGTHALVGSMYRANEYTVIPKPDTSIGAELERALKTLPEAIYKPAGTNPAASRPAAIERDYNPAIRKEGGLYVNANGDLMQVESGSGVALTERIGSSDKPIPLKEKEISFLKDWVGVRDALKVAYKDQLSDGNWQASLKTLRSTYDSFVSKHGPLRSFTVIERDSGDGGTSSTKRFKNDPLLRLDVEGVLAHALEKIDEASGEITPDKVLVDRVLAKPREPEIRTVNDALFVSLNANGRLDIDHVAKLAGMSRDEAISTLGSEIFEAPNGEWQTSDKYLSGDVRAKLRDAEAAAKIDKRFGRNVEALLSIQPRPLGPSEITANLGQNWIKPGHIEGFAKEAMGETFRVRYSEKVGAWEVLSSGRGYGEFNTTKMAADEILLAVLNNRQIRVTQRDADGKHHLDTTATESANSVATKMREAFRSWVWTDKARADEMVSYYNDHFNNIAPRKFDGSHLTLPGVSLRVQLHPHQKRAIWRAVQDGDTYLAHAVGAGKTYSMIAAGMEERRLGLSKKPMFVVPNHMLAQFAREFLELYPAANIMVADETNFHTSNRRRFIAQAALNDPDAIIITHSAFGRIGMSDEYSSQFITGQIEEWKAALDDTEKTDRFTRKQIERRIEQLERRLEAKAGDKAKKDAVLTFEEIGADRIFLDEAHEFRKLDFATNQGAIKGIDPSGSMRAMDLHMKVSYLREKNPGRALVMASGTPITNTMGELFTVQRFFQPAQLEADGHSYFDAWSNHYGAVAAGFEQNAAGGYEIVSRFAKFQNVPELMRRVRSFMDILTSSDLGALVQRPEVKGGGRRVTVTETPDGYKEYQKELQSRITTIRNRKGPPKPGDDIILTVIADGRFSAFDMRFVDPALPSDPKSKLNQAIDAMVEAYRSTSDRQYLTDGKPDQERGSSIVMFSDIGLGDDVAEKRGFDMRGWIEKRLIAEGIQQNHVAFIKDHKTHAKKERLFADMREGKKRILIGGKGMETGVNVQKRLAWLGHLDAPWYPASVEQREGRIIRQGNQNKEVTIQAFATKGSYDSTMWGMNARKARFIEQAMNGDETVRSLEDVSEASAFEVAAALASGDERYLKLAGLKADVERLERLAKAHHDEQRSLGTDRYMLAEQSSRDKMRISEFDDAIQRRKAIRPGGFEGKVGSATLDTREAFSNALFKKFSDLAGKSFAGQQKIGEIGGFDLTFTGEDLIGKYRAAVRVNVPGRNDPIMSYPLETDMVIAGIATRAANQVNGLERTRDETKSRLEQNTRRIKQIEQRIGAPFSEQSDLIEKHAEYMALQSELAAETSATQAAENAEAAAATVEVDGSPVAEESVERKYSIEPAISLTGDELGVDFQSGDDMPALRTAAAMWYDSNLKGTTARMKDGTEVKFGQRGRNKSTSGKGDELLRSVPSIRQIIETGEVVSREPGNRDGVIENVVVAAPIRLGSKTIHLAVSIHHKADGSWHYNLTFDRDKGAGAPEHTHGRDVRTSLGSLDAGTSDINLAYWDRRSNKIADRTSALRAELATHPLGSVARKLIDVGKVKIIDQAPADAQRGAQGWTDPDGTVTLVAGVIPEGRAMAVLLHEAFHAGVRPLLGNAGWAALMRGVTPIYHQFERGSGPARAYFDAARVSVRAAGVASDTLAVEEFAAYAVEHAEQAPRALRVWVDQAVGHVKAWLLRRFGVQVGSVTLGELRALSAAALRGTGTRAEGSPMAAERKYSVLPSSAEAVAQIKGKLTDLSPAMLATIPLNYFSEMKRPAMTAIDKYLGLKRDMDTYRGKKHEQADKIAQEWLSYIRLGFGKDGKAKATELAELMHDSTLAGVDPSMSAETFGENGPPESYASLRDRFLAMPGKGQALFEAVRDGYKAQSEEMDAIIVANVRRAMEIAAEEAQRTYLKEVERIEKSKTLSDLAKADALNEAKKTRSSAMQRSQWANKARITRLREAFESSRLTGPYFPLARFGRYFVSLKDVDGEVLSFQKFERAADMDAAADEIRALAAKDYPGSRVESGVLDDTGAARQAMDPRLVAEVETILGNAKVDPAVMDTIWQRYLETMPEMSIRKRQIHRKGTAGFNNDALRIYANHMFHASHQMARMKFGLEMQEEVNKAAEQARASDDPVRGSTLVNELRQRHGWVMNPTGSAFAQKITSSMFVWYLAASPASAMVNLTQTVIVGLPVLGARLGGISKAAPAMMRAASDFIAGRGDARKAAISADEKRAMDAFYETGLIDRTRSHDLAGVGNTGAEYSPIRARVMEKISWMFHNAEVMNREVTALAAYRLARAAGETHDTAVNTAHDLTWKTHFDYSNSNRPRIMQGDVAKVALVFQNFQINMWYRFFRDIHQSLKGETAQARREARYQIAGITGMLALLGGVTSVFGFKAIMMLAGLFFDDKDDPRGFEEEFKTNIMKMFGPDIGAMVLKGAPGTLLNVDLASRIGMPDFLVRTRDTNKEGRDAGLEFIASLMGASVSTVLNGFDGVKLIADGKVARGMEIMAPKAVKDLMQAYRFSNEGLQSRRGNTVLERDKMTAWDIGSKAIGFTSARVSETYERNRVLNSAEKRVLDERKQLVEMWATARMHNDDDARSKAMEQIKEFNARPYARGTVRISQDTLMQSVRVRRANDIKRHDGVLIENKGLDRHLRGLMPERTFQ